MDRLVGKTKHGELSLDEIAGLAPGMSEWMLALEAMRRRSWEEVDRLTAVAIEASDRNHAEWGYEYVRYRRPAQPPADYLLPPPPADP